jgi:Domain of unknown function (DUF4342)
VDDKSKTTWKSFAEEIEVSSKQLLSEINRLVAEGNVRKLVIKSDDGHVFLTIPLTAGAVVGGIVTLGAPWLAVLAAVAGLVGKVKIEIIRSDTNKVDEAPKSDEANLHH